MRGAASVAGERVTDQKFKSKSAMKHALQEEGELKKKKNEEEEEERKNKIDLINFLNKIYRIYVIVKFS